jgi:hypothetical protein
MNRSIKLNYLSNRQSQNELITAISKAQDSTVTEQELADIKKMVNLSINSSHIIKD